MLDNMSSIIVNCDYWQDQPGSFVSILKLKEELRQTL